MKIYLIPCCGDIITKCTKALVLLVQHLDVTIVCQMCLWDIRLRSHRTASKRKINNTYIYTRSIYRLDNFCFWNISLWKLHLHSLKLLSSILRLETNGLIYCLIIPLWFAIYKYLSQNFPKPSSDFCCSLLFTLLFNIPSYLFTQVHANADFVWLQTCWVPFRVLLMV